MSEKTEKPSPDYLLGSTARWTAGVRAVESLRKDRLFNDPWAAALANKEGEDWIEHQSADKGISIVVRTRFFDDFLQRVVDQDGIRQVVLMAAGLDMRAFRLNWPEQTRIFELDQPQVLHYKEQILNATNAKSTCERKTIAVNLTTPWRDSLLKVGFNTQQSSVWLLEGFLIYLPDEYITGIFDEITSMAISGSWLGFDIINSLMLTSPWTRQWIETFAKLGTPWIGTMDDPQRFLSSRGWKATLTQYGEEGANYGRWPYPILPPTMSNMPRNWLVTAKWS